MHPYLERDLNNNGAPYLPKTLEERRCMYDRLRFGLLTPMELQIPVITKMGKVHMTIDQFKRYFHIL